MLTGLKTSECTDITAARRLSDAGAGSQLASDVAPGVDTFNSSKAARRLYAVTCPSGMYDITGGSANYWYCGQGCSGGLYTDSACNCACQCSSGNPANLRGAGEDLCLSAFIY
eukprot:6310471-Prymnesium_polylepis.1